MNCGEGQYGYPKKEWTKLFSSNISFEFYTAQNLAVDKDKNSILTFRTNSTLSSNHVHQIILIKVNPNGLPIWTQNFYSYNQYENYSLPNIAVDEFGNILLVYTNCLKQKESYINITIIKLSPDGVPIWYQLQTINNTCEYEILPNVVSDTFGNFFVGYSFALFEARAMIQVHKINPWGGFVWTKQIDSFCGVGEVVNGTTDENGNYYLTFVEIIYESLLNENKEPMIRKSRLGTVQVAAVKISSVGSILWIYNQSILNSSFMDNILSTIFVDKNQNIYLAFNRPETNNGITFLGGHDLVIVKLNPSLGIQWVHTQPFINITCKYNFPNITCDEEGNVFMVYESWSTLHPLLCIPHIFIAMLNPDGIYSWGIQFLSLDTLCYYFAPSISIEDDSIFISYCTNNKSGDGDIVLEKLIFQ